MDDPASSESRESQHRWPIAMGVNLFAPIFMALPFTQSGGRIGMAAGIGVFWYLGHRVCAARPGLGRSLVVGGFLFAWSQIFPVVQMITGMTAVVIVSRLGPACFPRQPGDPGLTELGGLIATLTTGAILATMALIVGALVTMGRSRPVTPPVAPRSLLYDRHIDG